MGNAKVLGLGLVLAISACANEERVVTDSEVDNFDLITLDSTTVEATIAGGGDSLRLFATESEPGVVGITFDFGNTQIGFNIDKNRGEAQFVPNGKPLAPSQMRLVANLVQELQSQMAADDAERTTLESLVIRAGNLMLIVPTGEQLEQREIVHQNLGVDQTIYVSCQYQAIGRGYYRTAGKGCGCHTSPANGCAGRCGQGCGITSTPKCVGTTLYSKDCALHDYQISSWTYASDDYLFFSNNASCDGAGSCY